jgi:hypothetical protein
MEQKQAQVIYCKCGVMLKMCAVPYCYTDIEWKRDVSKYARKGNKIAVTLADEIDVSKCQCDETSAATEAQKQLSIFEK